MWPQYIFIAIQLLGFGIILAKWDEPKTGTYGSWATIIAVALNWSLLYYGGFFKGM